MYVITLVYGQHELYLRFFSFGLTLNWLLNIGIQHLVGTEPHIHGCGEGYSMPSWHAQHAFFFYTMASTALMARKLKLSLVNVLLLNSVPALVCAARKELGYNTFAELIAGTDFHFTEALR